jgi:hypothetical protein
MKYSEQNAINIIESLHNTFQFIGGNIKEEYPEQIMSTLFIDPKAKVLELGSSIGRNTLIISSILENHQNLVTLECDSETYKILLINKLNNNFNFISENCALSYRKLIQKEGNTIPGNELNNGYSNVNIITFQELEQKYNIQFDTFVVDCESAFYYILLDYPNMLDNIHTIIMENDYLDINMKLSVDKILLNKQFKRIYVKSGGWGPCYNMFYEVWQK